MAKQELFTALLARPLVGIGAFPVRRGQADAEAMRTAQALLEQGEVVVAFAEGTRVDEPAALGAPHHGAGRLAVATGAPIVPAAISGTARLWLGPVPKPRRVRVAFLVPVGVDHLPPGAEAVGALIDERVWPAVVGTYGRLQATPGPIAAGLAALGLGVLVVRRRRGTPPRVVGTIDPRRLRRARARRSRLDRLRHPRGG